MHEPPRRILLVRLSHLGDVVHALPVFHALRAAHPQAEIGWAVQPEFADLVAGLGGIARVFHFDRRGGARAWPKLWRELATWAPDWAVDAQGNVKSAMVTLGSRAPRRSGLDRGDWAEPFAATSSTDNAAPARGAHSPVLHAMDKMLALARHVAPKLDAQELMRTSLDLSPSELERGLELFTRFELGEQAAILHLATPDDVRAWPSEQFVELAHLLARERRVLLVSGPAEAGIGRAIEARLASEPRIRHWPGQRGLRELAALFTVAARRDAIFVGCDSGPMHLAWACGLRVTLLAGPQDERRTGPWPVPSGAKSDVHRIVRSRSSPFCAPCLERTCSHPEGVVCMRGIDPRDVALNRALPAAGVATQ